MFENYCYIHVYSPGEGADNPLGSEFLYKYKHKLVVTLVNFPVLVN